MMKYYRQLTILCHDEILQAVNNPLPVIKAAFDSITPEDCIGWIHHWGYRICTIKNEWICMLWTRYWEISLIPMQALSSSVFLATWHYF